jgi:phosphatidylinositol alpha-1,6-mannosyltransferase
VSAATKRRFLLALPGAFGPTGGIEAYNRLLVKAFHELAAEVDGACETLLLLDDGAHPDARYLDPGQPRPRGFGGSRPRFIAATLERIARFRPDLIVFGHINFGALALASRALAPLTPQWFIVHGVEVWRRMKPLSRLAVLAAQKTLAVSDYTRRELVRHNGVDRARVDLLPCALDPFWAASFDPLSDAAPPALDRARPLIITVARLSSEERHKGLDQILRALPIVARTIPGIRYAVVGGGDDRPRLEALAREVGVAERVEFRGRVTPAELAQTYAECSLFAMPSSQEGFGIVFLEAGLFRKASIGGAHGGTPEVIVDGETGRLVTYDDVPALAAAITALLTDPDRLRSMGERARRRVEERFTYATLLRTLRGLVHASRGAA